MVLLGVNASVQIVGVRSFAIMIEGASVPDRVAELPALIGIGSVAPETFVATRGISAIIMIANPIRPIFRRIVLVILWHLCNPILACVTAARRRLATTIIYHCNITVRFVPADRRHHTSMQRFTALMI